MPELHTQTTSAQFSTDLADLAPQELPRLQSPAEIRRGPGGSEERPAFELGEFLKRLGSGASARTEGETKEQVWWGPGGARRVEWLWIWIAPQGLICPC